MKHLIFLITLCLGCAPVAAQTGGIESAEVLRQLLALPGPTPSTGVIPDAKTTLKLRSQKFYDKETPPSDDAPIEDLLDYWERWSDKPAAPKPSDVVTQRLLEASTANPESLLNFLSVMPESAAARVKELYDREQSNQDANWREKVKQWLVFHSNYFLGELLALANKVKDNDKGGYVSDDEALSALAALDWSKAEPIVQRLANSNQPRAASFALSLAYKQAQTAKDATAEENYRRRLQAIAADRSAPGVARDTAIDILSLTDWSGREEWYISLLSDETLQGTSRRILPLESADNCVRP